MASCLSWGLLICLAMSTALCRTMKRSVKDWCKDNSGRTRSLHEEWLERRHYQCRCEYPESSSFSWDGFNPSDAKPLCQLRGCTDPSDGTVLTHGDIFINEQGYRCVCLQGTDPYVADAQTLYHTDCSLVLPEAQAQRWSNVNHQIPERLADSLLT